MTFLSRTFGALALSLAASFFTPLEGGPARADENPLPLLPGLEEAVEFWKVVFTRYGASEVIFHDTLQPMKIYQVTEVGENNAPRRWLEKERERIGREQGLPANEKRVRSQRGVKERFASGLKLSRRYLDQMQRILLEEGLPLELAYLPLVESSFDIRARSRAGALGMWQFMSRTGRKYMRVGPLLDERRDPLESTRAAARFLKQNHQVLGNWPLAITAYNHGTEGILRAIAAVGSRDLMEIIRRYESPSFGFASKSFYAEFLAAVELAKRSEEFFPNIEYQPPFPLEEVEVGRPVALAALLKRANIERAQFLEWNPALSPRIQDIPKGYRVKVPPEKLELFLAAYQRLTDPPRKSAKAVSVAEEGGSWIRHRVAPGETLSQIAKAYQISVHEIQQANRLASAHLIAAGQHLKIPKR
ncbi:MAG: transglycosylase SLT domain-containing protein [Deltaproteobacteria bacterium]|nr:transglycosylase SLT domain-containing protein [Deltaproteobacteria bacterium]